MLSVEALTRTPQFVGIGRDAVEKLWALGKVVQYAAGDELIARGSEARDLLIIESGSVELFFPIPILGATKEVAVERLGPGDVLAWSALIRPFALTLSGRCMEACTVRAFARDELRTYLKDNPEVGFVVMENLAGVVGRRLQHFQNLWIREVQARVVGLLG